MKVIRAILFIINAILALGLLLTTLAGCIVPSRMLLPSVAAYGYLPLLAANVVMILVWLLMHRWEFLLSTAVIALRWATLAFFLQFHVPSKAPDREEHPYAFALMSYNVHQFQGPANRPEQSDSNAHEFLSLVRRHQPELLCLQEYAAPKTVALTDSLMLLGYNHYYGAHTSKNGLPYGTVVFSKLPITYVTRIDSEKLLVELLHEGQHFRVCCVHMDSYRFNDSDREEMERLGMWKAESGKWKTENKRDAGGIPGRAGEGAEMKGLSTIIGKVKETILCHEDEWNQHLKAVVTESSVPIVLAGDLNDIPGSWLYRQISKELKDTFCEKGNGLSITYKDFHFRIDMVFHSEGFNTLSYKRIKSNLSDHYPILVTMEL